MEDFVNFEVAKKLKEKGFREKCFGYYSYWGPEVYYYIIQDPIPSRKLTFKDFKGCKNSYKEIEKYDAPTISQVLKWLRVEKNVICLPHIDPAEEKWFFYVVKLPQASDFPECMSSIIYNTYEEAALAGIEYVLDNLDNLI